MYIFGVPSDEISQIGFGVSRERELNCLLWDPSSKYTSKHNRSEEFYDKKTNIIGLHNSAVS